MFSVVSCVMRFDSYQCLFLQINLFPHTNKQSNLFILDAPAKVQQSTFEITVQTIPKTPQTIPITNMNTIGSNDNKNTKIVLLSTTTIPATIKPIIVNKHAAEVQMSNAAEETIYANEKADNSTANAYILSECG